MRNMVYRGEKQGRSNRDLNVLRRGPPRTFTARSVSSHRCAKSDSACIASGSLNTYGRPSRWAAACSFPAARTASRRSFGTLRAIAFHVVSIMSPREACSRAASIDRPARPAWKRTANTSLRRAACFRSLLSRWPRPPLSVLRA